MRNYNFASVVTGIATVLLVAGLGTEAVAQQSRRTEPPQQICLPETDPTSLRKSQLKGSDTSSAEVLRLDINKDGKPEIIERWWNGKRVRWFDENGNMTATDVMGDLADDSLQIDRDGDGYYDGPGDMNVDYVDDDGDGRAELEVVAMNPSTTQSEIRSHDSHYMIFEDVDKDGVFGCINWQTFQFECWGIDDSDPNFKPDYNGDSIFLKEHLPAWGIQDPRLNWENPFAFYDFDNDGCTEMTIRFCDNRQPVEGKTSGTEESYKFDGKNEEAYVSWDLDNDSGRGNELDLDMTLRMTGGEKMEYMHFVNRHPKLKAPEWTLPYFRYTNWRKIDELIYVPHGKCYEEIFKPVWGECFLTFDEDDDDHRWERVELYYPKDKQDRKSDPYNVKKWPRGKDADTETTGGTAGHIQSDTLGDRGEFDEDFSGRAKLYIGKWDNKIHLHGAEWGAWAVDYKGKYWGGAGPARGGASPDKAPKVEEVVQYADTDNNGFLDEITYDYDGDRTIDLRVSLLDYKDTAGGDVAEVIDPRGKDYEGMKKLYQDITEKSWQQALDIYRVAYRKGLNTPEMDNLAIASSTAEKYNNAYWIKEKIFRDLHQRLASQADKKAGLVKAHFTGDTKGFAEIISQTAW